MSKEELLKNYLQDEMIGEITITKEDWDDNVFRVESEDEEREYLVVTEEEATKYAEDEVISFIDDLGIGGFTIEFQDYILDNLVDEDVWKDIIYDMESSYVDELSDEEVLDELGLDIDSEEEYDMDELRDKLKDQIVDGVDDPRQYIEDTFGRDELLEIAKDNVDVNEIADECIEWDGIAHFIARYDGVEIDLGDGFYAYRQD